MQEIQNGSTKIRYFEVNEILFGNIRVGVYLIWQNYVHVSDEKLINHLHSNLLCPETITDKDNSFS